jgi:hypothetical protein
MANISGKIFCLALVLLLAGAGCSDDEPRQGRGQARPGARRPALAPVFAGLLINDAPAPRLTPDLPVYLTLSINNPLAKGKLALAGLGGLKPLVRRRPQGDIVALEWESPSLENATLDPGGALIAHWILKGGLQPGLYTVGLDGVSGLLGADQAGVSGVRVEVVLLEVKPGTADPALLAFLQRRILAMKGDNAAWLAAIDQSLQKEPDSHALHFERVEALEASRRPGDARRELVALMLETQKRLRGKNPKAPVHLPSWYYSYLSSLTEQARQAR